MCNILFCYIKGYGSQICQESQHLPTEISYAYKSQYYIGWYNMIRVGISLHYNQLQTSYLKEKGPSQDVHFFYTRSHFMAYNSCKSFLSTNFHPISYLNSRWHISVFGLYHRTKKIKNVLWLFCKLTYNFVAIYF